MHFLYKIEHYFSLCSILVLYQTSVRDLELTHLGGLLSLGQGRLCVLELCRGDGKIGGVKRRKLSGAEVDGACYNESP